MKNLKRALSLVLSAAMMVGMMAVGTAAASFKDVDAKDNLEAIEVLKAVGVMEGDDAGNFNPDALVTRNEMAVVMTNLLGLKAGGAHPFTDVPAWASDYVAACYANGTVAGTSATTFGGSQNVTAAQAALMVMKALGYFGYQGEFGDDWQLATIKMATKIDLFDGLDVYPTEALTRNEVAKLVLNALESDIVVVSQEGGLAVEGNGITVNQKPTYDYEYAEDRAAHDYNNAGSMTFDYETLQLTEKLFGSKLKKDGAARDDFGRPAVQWTFDGVTTIKTVKAPALTYTTNVKAKTIYADLGKVSGVTFKMIDTNSDGTADTSAYYVDGLIGSAPIAINSSDATEIGGKGTLTEVYFDKSAKTVEIVVINTFLAEAMGNYDAKAEKLAITVYDAGTFNSGNDLSAEDFEIANYKDGDFILVTAVTANGSAYTIKSIAPAEVVKNVKVGAYKANDFVTAGGVKYTNNDSSEANSSALGYAQMTGSYSLQSVKYDLILDNYGYVIGAQTHSGEVDLGDYLFVTDYDRVGFDYQAKVVFADGTKKTVVVSKTANPTVPTLTTATTADTADTEPNEAGKVAPGWFYTYNVTKSGEYELTAVAGSTTGVQYAASAAIKSGKAQIVNGETSKGNAATVVIADGKVTTGIKNAPDVTANNVWWLNDANGYTLWVFSKTAGSVSNSASEIVYVYGATPAVAEDEDDNNYWIYSVIKNGEKTTINVDANTDSEGNAIAQNKMYVIESYDDGYVDGTYFKKVTNGKLGGVSDATYKAVTSVSDVDYKGGTLTVTGTNGGSFNLADDVVIYLFDDSEDSIRTATAEYIKNITYTSDKVILVQESKTNDQIKMVFVHVA